MKIPSLKVLLDSTKETFLRFPFVILTSIVGAVVMINIIGAPFERQEQVRYLYNIVMACSLGIPFLIALKFISERMKLSSLITNVIQITGVLLLVAYYFSLPVDVGYADITRYLLFMIGMHLLVSFSPFVNKDFSSERNGFWQFNQNLFIRILITGVYSGVLYVGLAVAIVSFDNLFNAHINSKIYPQLFFFILGVFNTWFFLSGLPENLEELESMDFYPKGLKIFTQYVLLPLVIIYLLILYAYMGKIIVQWQLPMGWVSYLVLGFSITGIFSLLLIEPLREKEGINWIKKFSKWFYLILFPLIVLLFIAILRRTGEYGITEKRYFVFVLALWLTLMAIYFSVSKIKNIKIIPYTLCIITFITSFGPWGAISMSQRSQMNRLEDILTKNKILVEGKIVKATNPIPEEERQDVSSVIQFLNERKSLNKIQPWFEVNLDTIKSGTVEGVYKYKEAKITDLMGIEYSLYKKSNIQNDRYYYWSLREFVTLNIKDFDYLLRYNFNLYDKEKRYKQIVIDSSKIDIEFNPDSLAFLFNKNNNSIATIKIDKFIEDLKKLKTDPSMKDLTIEGESAKLKYKMVFWNVYYEKDNDKDKVTNISAEMLLKLK